MPIFNKHITLADFAIQQHGSIEAWFDIALLNDVELTEDIAPGVTLKKARTAYLPLQIVVKDYVPKSIEAHINKHQTLLDFSTQVGGSIEAWFEISALNNLSPTEDVAPGTGLQSIITNSKNAAFFIHKQITSFVDYLATQHGGIGYMQIGNNFKVN